MALKFDRLKTVYSYYTNKHVLETYPSHIGIELTNHCNLECIMCPQPRMTRSQGLMSEELFKKIIDEVKGKSEFIYLYGMGESLLHPGFFKLTDYAVKSGLTTSLSTNLTLLNEERSRKLLESGIDFIVLAFDGAGKDTYESIRLGGEFEKSLAQVKKFLQLKNEFKSKCVVDIQFILMDSNKHEAARMEDLFTKEERVAINTFRIKPTFIYPSADNGKIVHNHPCYFLWSTMTITWDGHVSICCMDYDSEVMLGDVRSMSVYEVWNSEKMAGLREKHKKLDYGAIPICDKCTVPEMDYFSTGTILASAILSAPVMRKLLAVYEKSFLVKK